MAESTTEELEDLHRPDQESSSSNVANDGDSGKVLSSKKESWLKRTWTNLGLDPGTLIMMFKGALPPTIALAILQRREVAELYLTIGYLAAIMSILSFAIIPRAKFTQTMFLNIIGVCIGACIALLTIYSSVQARKHTSSPRPASSPGPSPGTVVTAYNSSASAVSAIWLFFNIWLVSTLRASRPQFQFPVIMYSIFTNVASTTAPSFPTMYAGIKFVERLLETFLTGFAIAMFVSFFVIPVTCRTVFFGQSKGFIRLLQGVLLAQKDYMQSMEDPAVYTAPPQIDEGMRKEDEHGRKRHKRADVESPMREKASKLKATIASLGELHGKIHENITFAKRELAYGKLGPSHIKEIFDLMQAILLPVMGLASTADLFERIAKQSGWTDSKLDSEKEDFMGAGRNEDNMKAEKQLWTAAVKTLHEPFEVMTPIITQALCHVSYTLELEKRPKTKAGGDSKMTNERLKDVEADAGIVKPGDADFVASLRQKIQDFNEQRRSTLVEFWTSRCMSIDRNKRGAHGQIDSLAQGLDEETAHSLKQKQLYLILYIEHLLLATGQAVLKFVDYGDSLVKDGTMKKKRIINPGGRRMAKWLASLFGTESAGTEHAPDTAEGGSAGIYAGDSFSSKKDPEHLPPTNVWQRWGNSLRRIAQFLGSPESAFGFRVACATLTIGIVAFLKDTQVFFTEQRLVWAMIMVAIGMNTNAGLGVFGFIGRISGTAIAMCTSLIIWYIVDGHTPGVIVFIFLFTFVEFYFVLKYPSIVIIVVLLMVSQVLILGYELQVRAIGLAASVKSGQPYYPVYELAPYRLACVSGGMFVAFIWTFFPYPITARSQLRKDLGVSLYLLANFYSIVHTTVGLRIKGVEGDPTSKGSPGWQLQKARSKVYVKGLSLVGGLRQHSKSTGWEPSFGGRFPKETYDRIIDEVSHISNYLALISYASLAFSRANQATEGEDASQSTWIKDFSRLISSVTLTSQEITSTLALLSASVTSGNPLPPYMKPPTAYALSAKLEKLDSHILSVEHISEPGYSAFAVMQIASSVVTEDLGRLIENVKALVGEVDFQFHIRSSNEGSDDVLHQRGEKDKAD